MATLQTVLEEIEQDLTVVLTTAWDTTTFGPLAKVYIGAPEEGTTAKDLPIVALSLTSVAPSDDEEGSFCSESARLDYEIYLHAMKPRGRTLESEKRQRAQQLRTALKTAMAAGDIRHASQVLWMGDTYREEEDFQVAALSDAYVIRAKYQMFVEWTD